MGKKYIASVDAGNGLVNAYLHTEGKKSVEMFSEPSVRASASGNSLGLDALELDYTYVDFEGFRYITGDDVLRVSRNNLERHLGKHRYGESMHRFLVANALARMGVQDGVVDLVTFAPPGFYMDAKEKIEKAFTGEVEIQLKGDKKPRRWEYGNITVLPEGVVSLMMVVLDKHGKSVNPDLLAGQWLIIDVGAYTTDCVVITNGQLNLSEVDVATIPDVGVDRVIRKPALKDVKNLGPDWSVVTVDDIDMTIRRGITTGDYTLVNTANQSIDLSNSIQTYTDRFADYIANNVIDSSFNGLEGYRYALLVGGGGVLLRERLEQMYPEKVLNTDTHPTTQGISPVEFNAAAGLRYVLYYGSGK